MRNGVSVSGLVCVWFAVAGGDASASVTTESLLVEMTDLSRLTRLSSPAYVTRQFSSYDRSSKAPGDQSWFANGDRGHYLRVDERAGRKEHVMMDAEGPGAVVRIWSADPRGTLRIYLDGASKPVLEAPMQELLGGRHPDLPEPIAGVRARGWNLYFPFPYAKRCVVTCDEGGMYYHVNYRTYPGGTDVRTFALDDLARLRDRIRDVARRLRSPRDAGAAASLTSESCTVSVDAGADAVLYDARGARELCRLVVRLSAADMTAAARGLVLTMAFDGEQTVECPLGDFFGAAPGLPAYESLPLGITDEAEPALWCHWRMPFRERAVIAVRNLGAERVHVRAEFGTRPFAWDDRSLLFHARWRIERDIPTRPFIDWMHLDCTGRGRFVGGALYIRNGAARWWGEGDEKIYVDGEPFPSHFGTGSEDYYGYAWSSPARFAHAYHNQARCDGPGTYGHNSLNRFHILDDIPFERHFRFDMENWHHLDGVKVTRAAVSYWYARPGGTDAFRPLGKDDVRLEVVAPYTMPDAVVSERLTVLDPDTRVQRRKAGMHYCGGQYLRWDAGRAGEKLTLEFPSEVAGRKHVVVQLVNGPEFGTVQLSVNGRKAGEPIDLSGPQECRTDEIALGPVELTVGSNRITAEIVGPGSRAGRGFAFGIDCIRIR